MKHTGDIIPTNIVQTQAINMKNVNNFYAFLFVVSVILCNLTQVS